MTISATRLFSGLTAAATLALAVLVLPACTHHEQEFPGEEIAASVNEVPILRREVDRVFETTAPPGLSADATRDRRRQIIADLVRQEILAQQALKEAVEETPEHQLDMRLARRVALSARLERRALQQVPVITDAQIQQFLDVNRIPLGNRMLLTIEEVFLPQVEDAFMRELDKAAEGGADLTRLEAMATAAGVPSRRETSQRATDQLPPQILEPVMRAGVDKPVLVKTTAGQGVLLVLRQMAPAALSGAAAADYARSRMQRAYDRGALDRLYAQPFDAAAITYHGEFEDIPSKEPVLTEAPTISRRQWALAAATLAAWALFLPVLVGLLRFRSGRLWLPYVWPLQRPEGMPSLGNALSLAQRRVKVGSLRGWRLFVGRVMTLLWLAALAAIGLHTALAFQLLPFVWLAWAGVAGGLVLGFGAVLLLGRALLGDSEQKAPWALALLLLWLQIGATVAAALVQPGMMGRLLQFVG